MATMCARTCNFCPTFTSTTAAQSVSRIVSTTQRSTTLHHAHDRTNATTTSSRLTSRPVSTQSPASSLLTSASSISVGAAPTSSAVSGESTRQAGVTSDLNGTSAVYGVQTDGQTTSRVSTALLSLTSSVASEHDLTSADSGVKLSSYTDRQPASSPARPRRPSGSSVVYSQQTTAGRRRSIAETDSGTTTASPVVVSVHTRAASRRHTSVGRDWLSNGTVQSSSTNITSTSSVINTSTSNVINTISTSSVINTTSSSSVINTTSTNSVINTSSSSSREADLTSSPPAISSPVNVSRDSAGVEQFSTRHWSRDNSTSSVTVRPPGMTSSRPPSTQSSRRLDSVADDVTVFNSTSDIAITSLPVRRSSDQTTQPQQLNTRSYFHSTLLTSSQRHASQPIESTTTSQPQPASSSSTWAATVSESASTTRRRGAGVATENVRYLTSHWRSVKSLSDVVSRHSSQRSTVDPRTTVSTRPTLLPSTTRRSISSLLTLDSRNPAISRRDSIVRRAPASHYSTSKMTSPSLAATQMSDRSLTAHVSSPASANISNDYTTHRVNATNLTRRRPTLDSSSGDVSVADRQTFTPSSTVALFRAINATRDDAGVEQFSTRHWSRDNSTSSVTVTPPSMTSSRPPSTQSSRRLDSVADDVTVFNSTSDSAITSLLVRRSSDQTTQPNQLNARSYFHSIQLTSSQRQASQPIKSATTTEPQPASSSSTWAATVSDSASTTRRRGAGVATEKSATTTQPQPQPASSSSTWTTTVSDSASTTRRRGAGVAEEKSATTTQPQPASSSSTWTTTVSDSASTMRRRGGGTSVHNTQGGHRRQTTTAGIQTRRLRSRAEHVVVDTFTVDHRARRQSTTQHANPHVTVH